jgi:hypothetical protein
VASYRDFEPNQIKHMEMIQAVVARLAGNSFLMKGWALTLAGAFLGFGVNKQSSGLAAAGFLPIVVFWCLDTYYLRAERLFRALHERIRTAPEQVEPFFMGATTDEFIAGVPAATASWLRTSRRLTISGFYGLLALATVLVVVIICID